MIRVSNVSKTYSLYPRAADRVWEALSSRARHAEFAAVKNISFEVGPGQMLALVGPNGSGKSTLLQMVAGVIKPTTGTIEVSGRVAALLELGTGFNPEFTGRENVLLNGEILGRPREAMIQAMDSIAAFAGIGEFLDRPMKEYSTGMYVRLAFAAAIHVDPEVLIVDEALAVGDAVFANQCIRKFDELKRRGVTVLFVSHDLGLVKRLADRAMLLWKGEVVAEGDPAEVAKCYVGMAHAGEAAAETMANGLRHGDGRSEISSVAMLVEGRTQNAVDWGASVEVRVVAMARERMEEPVVGLLVRNRLGTDVFGTNTKIEEIHANPVEAGEKFEVCFAFPCWLAPGEYTLTVATQNADGTSQDWRDDAVAFRVIDHRTIAGVASPPIKVSWN